MDQAMTKEESYADRRQLFKDIWDTAMHMDEKDADVINKPKVIKTLRLDEVDRAAGKKKKQRLRNLRAVCNKLLDFCDRQDADDVFYEQMAANPKDPRILKEDPKPKKVRIARKRKIKKAKSLFAPADDAAVAKATIPDMNEEVHLITTSRNTSPIKVKRTSFNVTPQKATSKPSRIKLKHRRMVARTHLLSDHTDIVSNPRKTVKRRRCTKDQPCDAIFSTGTVDWAHFGNACSSQQ